MRKVNSAQSHSVCAREKVIYVIRTDKIIKQAILKTTCNVVSCVSFFICSGQVFLIPLSSLMVGSHIQLLWSKINVRIVSQVFTISICLFFIEQQSALFSKKLLAVAVSILIFAYLHRFILDTKQDLFLQKILFHNEKVEQ